MKRFLLTAVTLAALLAVAPSVRACPMCADAVPESSDGQSDFDSSRSSKGYNYTIYMFLATPALLCTGLGVMFYRQCRNLRNGDAPAETP